jgi:hypothetical protein
MPFTYTTRIENCASYVTCLQAPNYSYPANEVFQSLGNILGCLEKRGENIKKCKVFKKHYCPEEPAPANKYECGPCINNFNLYCSVNGTANTNIFYCSDAQNCRDPSVLFFSHDECAAIGLQCSDCVQMPQYAWSKDLKICGSTKDGVVKHPLTDPKKCPIPPPTPSHNPRRAWNTAIFISIVIGVILILGIAPGVLYYCCCKKSKKKKNTPLLQ